MPPHDATNLLAAFDRVTEHWSPKVIAQVNDQYLKVAKVQGEFPWHQHDGEDELFFIVRGSLVIELRDGKVRLAEGDFYVVPRGVQHRPVAAEECWILLVETVTTRHTGDVVSELTRSIDEQLS